jgi:hypothetical protein
LRSKLLPWAEWFLLAFPLLRGNDFGQGLGVWLGDTRPYKGLDQCVIISFTNVYIDLRLVSAA